MAILVSGGAGYIGSHTCIELLNAGYDVVVADNYYNASPVVLDRVKQITGKDFRFYQADMTKHEDVEKIFAECPDITAVIQFAAYKAVGESVSKPIEYYYNNLNCTLVILDVMRKHNCHNFVFSSSATVYGDPASVPITEDFPVGATTNPYGTTKAMTERILTDVCKADPTLNVALLRYFNPIGAHKSGLIGEDPNGIPNNLMPYIAKVAVGKLEKVHVFGNDYPTPDGTGVRDYIHVVDLARGHVCAIKKLETNCGLFICNLGTGKVTACWMLSTPSRRPAASPSLRHRGPPPPATSPSAMLTPPRPGMSLAGWLSTASRRCALTAGTGRRRTGWLPHRELNKTIRACTAVLPGTGSYFCTFLIFEEGDMIFFREQFRTAPFFLTTPES